MHKKVMIGIFAAILLALPVLTFIYMPKEARPFSEVENAYLAAMPELSFESVKNKNFMTDFESWFSDRFFARIEWIRAKNAIEKLTGKVNINGVYTAKNQMMQVWEGYNKELTDKNLAAMDSFAAENSETPTYAIIAPTSQELYHDLLPFVPPTESQKDYIGYCYEKMPSITGIEVLPALSEHKDDYIYYRTDHHWTSYGAYLAYCAAGSALGYEALPTEAFKIEQASDDFRGTLFSKTLDYGVPADSVEFYHNQAAEKDLKLTIKSGEEKSVYSSLYFRDFLDKKDKYSSFLGTNSPIMEIETPCESGKSILIFKDSYAHCFIPFLCSHYSKITVLDMRYIQVDIKNITTLSEYDQVLFLFNAVTFSESADIQKLSLS